MYERITEVLWGPNIFKYKKKKSNINILSIIEWDVTISLLRAAFCIPFIAEDKAVSIDIMIIIKKYFKND